MGWGSFLDKVMDKLPVAGRTERWKNQIDSLNKEKQTLMEGEPSVKKTNRIRVIDTELTRLSNLLKNARN